MEDEDMPGTARKEEDISGVTGNERGRSQTKRRKKPIGSPGLEGPIW
jgi:hypothetical protein